MKAFLEDAQNLSPEQFELRHGCGFLLGTGAGLDEPLGPSSTDVRLLDEGEDISGLTADVSVHVYPLRRTERSVVHLITVGRAPNNDVVVRDVSVSRFHAFAKRGDGGEFLLQDAGSTNGTTVKGAAVPAKSAGPPAVLRAGDTVRLGQVELTFVDAKALQEFVLQSA